MFISKKYTYVTLLSTDSYYRGVVMLDWSLRKVGTKYPLLVLCGEGVSEKVCEGLRRRHLQVQRLQSHIDIEEVANDKLHQSWSFTFDKLFVWSLTQYDKVVFVDGDMQVIRNIDYLFDCPHMSAVRADEFNEPGLDKLNSGLMVIEPDETEFKGLCDVFDSVKATMKNIGDQDVIRAYYADWGSHPELTLSPGLNVLYSEVTQGVIKKEQVEPVSVIHYIGGRKPWMVSPRGLWRRSQKNFLGKHLLRYGLALYWQFPQVIFIKGV